MKHWIDIEEKTFVWVMVFACVVIALGIISLIFKFIML